MTETGNQSDKSFVSPTAKRLMLFSAILSGAAAVVGAVGVAVWGFDNPLYWVLGVLWGLLITCGRVVLLERSLNKSLDMDSAKATGHARLGYLLRYTLTGAALVAAALLPFLNVIGTMVGVVTLQPAGYMMKGIMKNKQ